MTIRETQRSNSFQSRLLLDFLFIFGAGYGLKIGLDQFIWRYSGPVSLVIMLVIVFLYLRGRGQSWSWIGLVSINSKREFVLLPFQVMLAFISIGATSLIIGLIAEALGIGFMQPDQTGAQNRFGDVAGNTSLYLMWLAIVWIAGPAEELYFRGFMIGQLRDAFGPSRTASFISILVPALIFGVGHIYYQGLRGLVITGGIGLTLGILYLLYKRNIWPLMIAHAAFNSLTFTAVYMQWDM